MKSKFSIGSALEEIITRALNPDIGKDEADELRKNGALVVNAAKQYIAAINADTRRREVLHGIAADNAADRRASTDAVMGALE